MHNERVSFETAPNLMFPFHLLFVREGLDGGKSARLIEYGLMASASSLPYHAYLPHGIRTVTD